MKKIFLVVGVFIAVTGLTAQECSDLFFSEYVEGSGNNKGVEIYNPTGEIVPLNSYYVARYSNGNLTYESGGITQLQGFLQPYSTHFLANGQTTSTETSPACDPALQALAQQLDHDYPAPTYMNGNDAIALFKDPVGNGDVNDFLVMDLFGIIGGGMQSSDEGWAAFTDEWAYRNIYEGDQIVGRDSVFIQHFIVPDPYYWLPWTANHTLVRKPSVKEGVKVSPAVEFDVTMQWDTVPGGANVWDSLGTHLCDCEAITSVNPQFSEIGLAVYPNPVSSELKVEATEPFSEINLFDAAGKLVFQESFNRNEYDKVILTERYEPGIFYLKVRFRDQVRTKKVIIHR